MKPFSLPDQRLVMFDRHVVSVLFDLSSSRDEQRMWRYKQSDAMKAGITEEILAHIEQDSGPAVLDLEAFNAKLHIRQAVWKEANDAEYRNSREEILSPYPLKYLVAIEFGREEYIPPDPLHSRIQIDTSIDLPTHPFQRSPELANPRPLPTAKQQSPLAPASVSATESNLLVCKSLDCSMEVSDVHYEKTFNPDQHSVPGEAPDVSEVSNVLDPPTRRILNDLITTPMNDETGRVFVPTKVIVTKRRRVVESFEDENEEDAVIEEQTNIRVQRVKRMRREPSESSPVSPRCSSTRSFSVPSKPSETSSVSVEGEGAGGEAELREGDGDGKWCAVM